MSGFSAEWLGLREPYDHAARDKALVARVARLIERDPACIVDLACGTGSTARAIAPAFRQRQVWRLVDHDLALLAEARRQTASLSTITVETATADLAADPAAGFMEPFDLAVTSAFLDLVSPAWIGALADALKARQKPFYAALTYDGRASFAPFHALDAVMIDAFNRHQRTDKGFGPAAGPGGAAVAINMFKDRGFTVEHAPSDWVFGPMDQAIQRPMIDGWANAAREIGVSLGDVDAWAAARHAAIDAGIATMLIGHQDILAYWP